MQLAPSPRSPIHKSRHNTSLLHNLFRAPVHPAYNNTYNNAYNNTYNNTYTNAAYTNTSSKHHQLIPTDYPSLDALLLPHHAPIKHSIPANSILSELTDTMSISDDNSHTSPASIMHPATIPGIAHHNRPAIRRARSPIRNRGRRIAANSKIVCDICHQKYSRKDNLRVHQRVHTGEKPYQCRYCATHFRWLGTLRNHEKKHQRDGQEPLASLTNTRPQQPNHMSHLPRRIFSDLVTLPDFTLPTANNKEVLVTSDHDHVVTTLFPGQDWHHVLDDPSIELRRNQ